MQPKMNNMNHMNHMHSSFYSLYKSFFISRFYPLLLLPNSKIILQRIVALLESELFSNRSLALTSVDKVLVSYVTSFPMYDAQVFLEFVFKFYHHFTEIMRLYSLVEGFSLSLTYSFRFRTYLRLLNDINFVTDSFTDSSLGRVAPKWVNFYRGHMAQWLVNTLSVSHLTRDQIVNELHRVISFEVTLLNKNNLNETPWDIPDINFLRNVVEKIIERSPILTYYHFPHNTSVVTVIGIEESLVSRIVLDDNAMLNCKLLPMFIKPKDWSTSTGGLSRYEGGYITNATYNTESIVKSKWGCYLCGSISVEDVHVLNILQSFCFELNKPFYLLMKRDFQNPSEDVKKVVTVIDDILLKIQYYDDIYYPWSCDFRYRKYALGGVLSTTNSVLPRFILSFKYKYKISDSILALIRAQLVRKTINKLATDNDCLKYDDIFLLDFCKSKQNKYDIEVSKLCYLLSLDKSSTIGDILWFDHNCSGFMFLSLLFKDKDCAKLLNLIDNDKVYDFYSEVVTRVVSLAQNEKSKNGDSLVYPFKRSYTVQANANDVGKTLKSCFDRILCNLLSKISKATPIKDICKLLDDTEYPIVETNTNGVKRYYTFTTKIIITKTNLNKYYETNTPKVLCDLDKFVVTRIYTINDIMDYIASIPNKRSILKKLIMCIPYLITKTTGIKNLKTELSGIQTEESEELDSLITETASKNHEPIVPASYYLYKLTLIAINEVAPNVMGGMCALAKTIQKSKKERMRWVTPSYSVIDYTYLKIDTRSYFYGPSVSKSMIVREPIKDSVDLKQNYTSSIAHFIHSLDASLITMVVNTWHKKYPGIPITTVHDAYGIPYTHASELRSVVKECLSNILTQDPLTKYIKEMAFSEVDVKNINRWVGTLNTSDIKNAYYFLR